MSKEDFQRAKIEVTRGLKILGEPAVLTSAAQRAHDDLIKLRERIKKRKTRANLVDKSLAKGVARLVNRSMKEGRDGEGVKKLERMAAQNFFFLDLHRF